MESNIFDTALVFEGGGMRCSYSAGFVNMLLENEIYINDVYGLSAGASNTVNYLTRDKNRVKASFVDIASFPGFCGFGSFLTGKGYFDAYNIYQCMGKSDGPLPFNLQAFLDNPAHATIQSFNRDTGETVYWTKDDMRSLNDIMVRVRASSTLPVAMPSPQIDGNWYYDGGLGIGAGFILPRAIDDGFKRFVIVRSRPKGYRKTDPGFSGKLINAALHKYPKVCEALNTRKERYNAFCDQIEQLEAEGSAFVFYAENQACESGDSDMAKLEANYQEGYKQAYRDLPALKEFLGI
ncbi:patatin-like phospholipase family protein [Slackia heliotrinireducens]|uniref:patatin-like phospholipase family protein n=1 Tax=Slackia heliotrinireducens TaxID=84110 RepID=UPI003315A589